MDELLKKLSECDSVSGDEKEIREIIIAEASKYAEVTVDKIGNVIAYKKGKNSSRKVMLAAHMDEVGFIVSYIEDNGFIRFKPVGGIDQRVLLAKRVRIGKDKILGVFGIKAIHLQSVAERGNVVPMASMYIDVGASSKDGTGVKVGDYISFTTEFEVMGDNKMKGKALDDSLGCRALLELLKNDYDDDIYACFTVQEEVGTRGAGVAAFSVRPDIAIIVEGTTCADVPGVEENAKVTAMDKGPAVSYMDAASIGDKKLVGDIISTAEKNGITYQIKRAAFGGNDAGTIRTTAEGTATAVISVPCRYIHSPVSVASYDDYNNTVKLIDAYLSK